MKQTNGALTLLLKAYRSVFKAAYIKGLASAVILTAGLSAGVANAAAANLGGANSGAVAGTDYVITGDSNSNGIDNKYQYIQIGNETSGASFDGTLTITGGAAASPGANYVSGSAAAVLGSGKGTIIISTKTATEGLLIGNSGSVLVDTVNINTGTIKVSGGTSDAAASLEAKTLNIGNARSAVALNAITASLEIAGGQTAGKLDSSASASQYSNSSTINLNHGGKIDFTGAKASAGTLQGATLNINGGFVTVASDSGGIINVADGKMTAGTIDVASGGTLTFNFKKIQNGVESDGSTPTYAEKNFTVSAGTLDIAGTLVISGDSTPNGVFDVSNDAVDLRATTDKASPAPTILTSGAGTTLKISAQNATEYLTQTTGVDNDQKGRFTVSGGSTFEFSDDTVTLNNFKFASTATDEAIFVNSGTIKGNNIIINGELDNSTADDGGAMTSGTLEANNLTVNGVGSVSGAANAIADGLTTLNVHNNFTTSEDTFTLNGTTITLGDQKVSTDKTIADTTSGTFDGKNLVINATTTNVLGNYHFAVDSIKLAGGSINVGSGDFANVTSDADTIAVSGSTPTTITVSGGATTQEEVNGHDVDVDHSATLDLSNVSSFDLAEAGTTALAKYIASGDGTIILNGTTLTDVLEGDETATSGHGFAINGGTIKVEGNLETKVGNLVSATLANTSGNTINFATAASATDTLEVNGRLTLIADDNTDALNIGNSGSIIANDILLQNPTSVTDENKGFTVSAGSLTVLNSLSSAVDVAFNGGSSATLNLGKAEDSSDKLLMTNQGGTVNANLTFSGDASATNVGLKVNDGQWALNGSLTLTGNSTLTVGESAFADNNDENTTQTTFNAQRLNSSSTATTAITINPTAEASFTAVALTGASPVSIDGGKLTINGEAFASDSTDTTIQSLYNTYGAYGLKYGDNLFQLTNGGTLTITGVALSGLFDDGSAETGNFTTSGSGDTLEVVANLNSDYGTISVKENSTLALTFGEDVSFSADEYVALKEGLIVNTDLDSTTGQILSGRFDIGAATITGFTDQVQQDADGYYFVEDWDNIAGVADKVGDAVQEQMNTARIEGIDGNDKIVGNYGSLHGENAASVITIAGNSSLSFSEGNEGFFASYEQGNTTVAADLNIEQGVELNLNNGGNVGTVTLAQGTEKNPTILYVNNEADDVTTIEAVTTSATTDTAFITQGGGTTNVTGNVNVKYYEAGGHNVVGGNITTEDLTVLNGALEVAGRVDTDELWVENGSSFESTATTTANKRVETGIVYVGENSTLTTGTLNVTSNGNTSDTSYIAGDVVVDDLTLDLAAFDTSADSLGSNEFQIANGSVVVNDTLTLQAGTYVRVGLDATEDRESVSGYLYAKNLELNGGTVITDPDVTVAQGGYSAFSNFTAVPTTGVTANRSAGTLDGILAVGQNSVNVLGGDDEASSLELAQDYADLDGVTSAVIVDKPFTTGTNGQIIIDTTRTGEQIKEMLNTANGLYTGVDLALVGEDTAAVVTQDALDDANAVLTAATGAIADYSVFNGAQTILSNGGKVIADVDDITAPIPLFDGATVLSQSTNDLTVTTVSGILAKTYKVGETIDGPTELEFNPDVANNYKGQASDPIFYHVMAYAAKDLTPFDDTDGANGETALHSDEWISVTEYEKDPTKYNVMSTVPDEDNELELKPYNSFLNEIVKYGNLSDAETVARMAIYGGAAEVGLVASTINSEAIASRLGMGNPNSALTFANNADGAGIWLAPFYKNHESDGFDAEGVDYGVDLDMAGVSLGVDYTLADAFRFGAMFSIGSGDADGQDAGSAVSNDFDFWGASLYAGYTYDKFAVTADLGYTAIDNDIDANTSVDGYNRLSASVDAKAVTFGVNAQYGFEFDVVDVTPHIGARFTRLDIDDYSITDVAETNMDSMNVFSIPVGVAFSKDINTASGWNIKPSLDLVVTANTGDDEVDSDVRFNGVDLTTDLSTEVIDSVTYGANLGLQMQTGSFEFGVGVNYTGSENTDEFGVNANARFTF